MIETVLLGTLIVGACVLMTAMPWIVCGEIIIEARKGNPDANGLAFMVCAGLCLFEVAAVIDWLIGKPFTAF